MNIYTKGNARRLFCILTALILLTAALVLILERPSSNAATKDGYNFSIINFTPDNVTVTANRLHDGEYDEKDDPAVPFTNKNGLVSGQGSTKTSSAILETKFNNVTDGYVVGALMATRSGLVKMERAIASGKTFKDAYIEYYKSIPASLVNAFRPAIMSGLKFVDGQTVTEYSYSFGIETEGYNPFNGDVYILTGAFPADEKAITITVDATPAMKMGSNHMYADNMKVSATIINNASYPILFSTNIENEHLVTHNPENNQHNDIFHLNTVSKSSERSGEFFIAPAGVVKRSVEFNTCYYDNGTAYYGAALAGIDSDIARATTTVNNITYSVSKGSNLPESESKLEVTTETAFPAKADGISSFIQWKTRPTLTSVSPGMIGIFKTNSNKEPCFTGLADDGTFELSFSGKNMDRVRRIVITPRAGTGKWAQKNDIYLKNAITYTNVDGKWTELNNGGTGDIRGWWYKIRPIKTHTAEKIVIKVDPLDMYGFDPSNQDRSRISTLNDAFYQDSFNKTPDYLDIYVLSADEDRKPVQTTQWFANDPNIISNRMADFSLPLSHTASKGAAYVNTGGAKVGGNYLSIVPTTIVNGKPNSKRMTVTNEMTATQQLYKGIMFSSVGSQITSSTSLGTTTWKMTANNGIKVNEYLQILPDAPNKESFITIEELGTTITIKSENCKLYAENKQLFFDFYSVLDETTKKYWYSNPFDKVSSEAASQSAKNKYDEKTGEWLKGAKLYGTGIKAADMHKIKFLPLDKESGGLYFDAGVLKGGVTAAYPYVDNVGLEMELQTLTFLPQFVREFLVMDDWNKTLAEVRYPYTGDMPQISTDGPIELAIGGNFMVFSLGATACLDINTLWEERNIFGITGSVNLFNKLQVDATVLLREFGSAGMVPDEIAFTLGSDIIGLVPPVPFLQISSLGGAITGIGSNTINKTWRNMPTPDFKLEIGGEIGIPHTQIDIGFEKAYLTLGLNRLEIGMENVFIGPVTISEYLSLKYAGDFTSDIEIPGTNGFKLPMPVFNISGKGQIGLSVTKYLSRIINAQGEFEFKFDTGKALRSFFNAINTNSSSFKKTANELKAWVTENGSKDMVSIMALLKNMGFDYLALMKSTAVNFFDNGALEVTASVEGSIKVPENIPHFGGKVLAGGTVTLRLDRNILSITAVGELLNEMITGGFAMTWDITKGIGKPNTSLLSYSSDSATSGYTLYTTNLENKDIPSYPVSNNGGIKVQPLSVMRLSTMSPASSYTFTVEEGETTILISLDATAPTDITLTPSTGDPIVVSSDNETAWTALYDANNDGWIDEDTETRPYAYRFNYIIKTPGDAGTVWTISGDGITYFGSANVLPTETVSDVVYVDRNTVTFDFDGLKKDAQYRYELLLVDEYGTKFSAATGTAENGANTVSINDTVYDALQSGNYYALVTIITAGDEPQTIPSQGVSETLSYTNAVAPTAPSTESIDYIGDGSYEITLSNKNSSYGYEVRITGENSFELVGDYLSNDIIVGEGLSANKEYTAYVRAYVISNGHKIFGPESAGVTFTVAAAAPAEVTLDSGSLTENPNDGVFYAALSNDDTPTTNIVFASNCDAYTVTIFGDYSETAIAQDVGDGNLSYTWELDLRTAAQYTAIITTVNALGDTGSYTFRFEVDGEAPRLLIDQGSVIFDGANLSFDAYLEPGAEISDASLVGTWLYDIADADERAENGNYFGTWTGTATVTPKDITATPDDGESTTISTVYEITVTASDFAGNATQVLLLITAESADIIGVQQLILNTSVGHKLSLGMTDISLLASVLIAPSFTEKSVGIGLLTNVTSSNTDVVTVDAAGNITIIGKGNATLSASYDDGTKVHTATLNVSVTDTLSLEVSVKSVTQNSTTLLLPALPGFNGDLEVYSSNQLIMTLTQGFEEMQLLTIENLIEGSVISLRPIGATTTYAETRIYFSAPAVCSCDKCATCNGCTAEECCDAGDCSCVPCPGHCDCDKCETCGGCITDGCCDADDCDCEACPGHIAPDTCDCDKCETCGGCITDECCNADDCDCEACACEDSGCGSCKSAMTTQSAVAVVILLISLMIICKKRSLKN